ncbi:aldo/keto reductase [Chromobacterium sp. ASV23]|uniref:aldo/keto reductase n=1 Tax=Chromobacterium sp. ASV23 TaxID=2795110 RepID=UPI0018EB9F41|nr:aldo/keto reductase [Chromobacterium sp. ASV23]
MKYVNLAETGLKVSQFALGTMTFGIERGVGATEEESERIFQRYIDLGGNFIDTANTYTDGSSERFIGRFAKSRRQSLVLASKYGLTTDRANINASGSARKNLVQSVENSLRRLDTDYLDLLWLHAWDAHTRPEETLRALDDLVRAGKVLHLGISNAPAWWIARANAIAELRNWTVFAGVQFEYSLIERSAELELLPMAAQLGLTPVVWSPLGGGLLTGKYNQPASDSAPRRLDTFKWLQQADASNLTISQRLADIAQAASIPMPHLALAWIQFRFPTAIPIVGSRSAAQLEQNLACLQTDITAEILRQVDSINQPDPIFPYSYLQSPLGRSQVYSDFHDRMIGR